MLSDKEKHVDVPISTAISLEGTLRVPHGAKGIVIFAHGSGSSRHSPRNRFVAEVLNKGGLATLLIDLLTSDEEKIDQVTGELRFDINLLTERLSAVSTWVFSHEQWAVGYFGASTGAAAALRAAAKMGQLIQAVVSRGGRPDLAAEALRLVKTPTLLIVGGSDEPVIGMNEEALGKLNCEKKMVIVPQATHLFEEPGALEQVAELALQWFRAHLVGPRVKKKHIP